jgi:hypothetical protein
MWLLDPKDATNISHKKISGSRPRRYSHSYVVSNPSAYVYVDGMRPTSTALPTTIAATAPGFMPPPPTVPPRHLSRMPTPRTAWDTTTWPYGLKNRDGYAP